jgi:4'-phosphopantetheinyl transferase
MNNTVSQVDLYVRYIELQHNEESQTVPLLAQLSAAEQERAARFRFPRHRVAYIAAHALRAAMLRSSEAWQPAGRLRRDLRTVTSLTHTDGLVACGLAQAGTIGVDAEAITQGGEWPALLDSVLTHQERACLEMQSQAERPEEFLRYWTLKEAISKALGVGLALPFQAVSLSLAPLQLLDLPQGFGTSHGWHLEEHRIGSSHRMAVAVRHGPAEHVKVLWQPTTIGDVIAGQLSPFHVP